MPSRNLTAIMMKGRPVPVGHHSGLGLLEQAKSTAAEALGSGETRLLEANNGRKTV